jgi:hypothetical protein
MSWREPEGPLRKSLSFSRIGPRTVSGTGCRDDCVAAQTKRLALGAVQAGARRVLVRVRFFANGNHLPFSRMASLRLRHAANRLTNASKAVFDAVRQKPDRDCEARRRSSMRYLLGATRRDPCRSARRLRTTQTGTEHYHQNTAIHPIDKARSASGIRNGCDLCVLK